MSGRRCVFGAALLASAVGSAGCGGNGGGGHGGGGRAATPTLGNLQAAAPVYATKWSLRFRLDASGRPVQGVGRGSRRITLEVIDSTCDPRDPSHTDVTKRFFGARVKELRFAVVVTMLMRAVPSAQRSCAGAGVGFPREVLLAHPLGARALVDGGDPRIGGGGSIAVIRVPASDARTERLAERRFGPPDLGAATP